VNDQHKLIIKLIGGLDTKVRFRIGAIARDLDISRSTVYQVVWRLQIIGAVRHHGYDWSLVRRRWSRGIDAVIDDYEWACRATPVTQRLLEAGRIHEARSTFRKE
jgi:DNA-binding IclR family transcriptional regulator